MPRFIAEHENGISYAIDAPSEEAARRAAERYTGLCPLNGPVTGIRQPPPFLRVGPDGQDTEILTLDGFQPLGIWKEAVGWIA